MLQHNICDIYFSTKLILVPMSSLKSFFIKKIMIRRSSTTAVSQLSNNTKEFHRNTLKSIFYQVQTQECDCMCLKRTKKNHKHTNKFQIQGSKTRLSCLPRICTIN